MDHGNLLHNARSFIYGNARLLDRRRYEYWFEDGSGAGVIDALRSYRNEDGGFGGALEPDIRCPHSQPVPTEMALGLMDEIGHYDSGIMEGILRYLSSIAAPQGGFPLVFRSAMAYPHAPWWKSERDDEANINPTGQIAGLLLKWSAGGLLGESWFAETVEYVWRTLEQTAPQGYHDGIQWVTFLQHAPDRARAARLRDKLDAWLTASGAIERNTTAEGYVHKVLDWAPLPDSYARRFVSDDEVEAHLDDLIARQREDGGWGIGFPAVSAAGELEWRGSLAVDRLKTLRAYGRI